MVGGKCSPGCDGDLGGGKRTYTIKILTVLYLQHLLPETCHLLHILITTRLLFSLRLDIDLAENQVSLYGIQPQKLLLRYFVFPPEAYNLSHVNHVMADFRDCFSLLTR